MCFLENKSIFIQKVFFIKLSHFPMFGSCRDKGPEPCVGSWALSEDVWVIRGETNSYKKFQFEVSQGRDEWRAVQG